MNIKHIIFALILSHTFTVCYSQHNRPQAARKDTEVKEIPKWRQVPEKPNETVMAAWAPLNVEHYIGLRGGYGIGTVRFIPSKNAEFYAGLINFGVSYRIDVPEQRYGSFGVGCLEFDLEYLERGYRNETWNESGNFYERKYSVLSLPILWQPYIAFTKTGESRLYFNAGTMFSYAIGNSYERYFERDEDGTLGGDNTSYEGVYKYDKLKDNRWEYGVTVGAGVILAIKKRWVLGVDLRYNIMLSDTFKDQSKYPGNPFRSPVDQINLSVRIGYKIAKTKRDETTK